MTRSLTAAGIRTMKPTDRRREIKDGGSTALYLVVQPSGHKSFALRFRNPKPSKLVLGVFDPSSEGDTDPVVGAPLTLAGARKLAAELLRQRARGKDIIAERRRTAEVNTFEATARQFILEHVVKTRCAKQTARILGLDGKLVIKGSLMARWADKPMAQITSHDIFAVVDEAKRRGIPGRPVRNPGLSDARGRNMARTLSRLFSWSVQNHKISSNPCTGMFVPPAPASRDRVLSEEEIIRFWQAASAEPYAGPALKLLLLTGCRLREVTGMRRSELSDDVWTIPGQRTKNKRTHVVPLPPLARDLIPSNVFGSDLVFTNGKVAINGWSKTKHRIDQRMGIPPWRLHDLRRTAVTHMAELGIAPHVIELIVNHVSGFRSGVAGIYNKAELMPQRRAALEKWSLHISKISSEKIYP